MQETGLKSEGNRTIIFLSNKAPPLKTASDRQKNKCLIAFLRGRDRSATRFSRSGGPLPKLKAETGKSQQCHSGVAALLEVGLTPRVLSRAQAAAYCGVAPATFDKSVREGILPKPIPDTRRWDRVKLDLALDRRSGIASPSTASNQFDQWKAERDG